MLSGKWWITTFPALRADRFSFFRSICLGDWLRDTLQSETLSRDDDHGVAGESPGFGSRLSVLSHGPAYALRGVDLSLERGARLGVVGESGAGKSMVAFSILNLVSEPGRIMPAAPIMFDGVDLTPAPRTGALCARCAASASR